jgi:hypothetical protein
LYNILRADIHAFTASGAFMAVHFGDAVHDAYGIEGTGIFATTQANATIPAGFISPGS